MLKKQQLKMPTIQHKNLSNNCMEILLMTLKDKRKSNKSMIGLYRRKNIIDHTLSYVEKNKSFDFLLIFNFLKIYCYINVVDTLYTFI